MKRNILFVAIAALAIGFTSCAKKCKTCTHDTLTSEEVCEDDYGSTILYNAAITGWESLGYTCE